MDEDRARLATWLLKRLGNALAIIGALTAIGAVVALATDHLVWLGAGAAAGLVLAGITLRDTNAVRDLSSGRPVA